jgi:sugar/nucleoside kinase (ribokinase family)
MLDILSIGNANIDSYPDGKQFCGGSASNFAVGCAKLGLKAGFLGFIGNDKEGKMIEKCFKKNSVKSMLIESKEKTGSVKILSAGFRKKFSKSLGANINLKNLSLEKYLKISKRIHLATPPIELLKQLKPGLRISVDSGSELAKYSINELAPYLKNVEIFFLNESEAKKITGKDCLIAAKKIIEAGVKIAVIKKKSEGVLIKTINEEINLAYLESKVIDATGGGDAFASAFIYGLIKKKSIKDAGILGIKSSAMKIKKMGAQSTPYLKDLIKA